MTAELGATTTTDDVLEGVDLSGKRAIVTGASTGLGEETTRALAAHGAAVTMAVRDVRKGEEAASRIRMALPTADLPDLHLDIRQLELGSLASVRAFAEGFLADHDKLDLLILNAGVMACPYMTTEDGFELQFGTNHLGHFLLAELLAPALVAAAPSRVVSLSSGGHRIADVDLDDPGFEHTEYSPWVGYGRSKTANVLFAVGFEHRYGQQGVHAYSVHPGMIATDLGRHLTKETASVIRQARTRGAARVEYKTIPQGAATTLWAATVPGLETQGGAYLEDCHVATVTDDPDARGGVRSYAIDLARADALWELSERLTSA
jgi:NAD(P)-dependent dehydrogenase (short-subunit alcohol dehydrogenase family)